METPWTRSGLSRPRAVGIALGAGIAGFAVGFAILLLVGTALGRAGIAIPLVGEAVISLVALQGVAFPLVALAVLRLRGLSLSFLPVRVPSLREWGVVVLGFLAAFGLAMALLVAVVVTGAPTAQRADQQLLQSPEVLLVLLPLAFLLIGPGEELLFRGIIQGTLREAFGPVGAILLASLAFAPAHIVALVGSPVALLVSISVLFVPSVVFGAVYEYTENLAVPALVHGAYDFVIFGMVYLAVTYGPQMQNGAGALVALGP